jgi:hypothetical protein
VVDDNNSFFGTIRPALEAGQDTGWDIVTLTDWMAHSSSGSAGPRSSTSRTCRPHSEHQDVQGLAWDPEMKHHAPWQSGMTGLGYDVDVTGDLTNLDTLFTADPKWNGKVDYLSEMRDAVGLAMLSWARPDEPTTADDDAAIAESRGSGRGDVRLRATPTPRTSRAATRSSRWRGRATWSRRSSTSCRSASRSPTRILDGQLMIPKSQAPPAPHQLLLDPRRRGTGHRVREPPRR